MAEPASGCTRLLSVRPFLYLLLLSSICRAQTPAVGTIDVYGNRSVAEAEIRKLLGTTEGGKLPSSKGAVEERLEQELEQVTSASLFAACCEAGKLILYVGVEEKGGPSFQYRTPPETEMEFPQDLNVAYGSFLDAVRESAATGPASEDLSQGHSLFKDPKARALQQSFIDLANRNFAVLRNTIRESATPEHRAMAAYMIGYASNKQDAAVELQYALKDPDDTVRENATRALAAIAVLAARSPDAALKISPTWFVEMLNSVTWTDRNNAAIALVNLTESRDEAVLTLVRERALPALMEMARWKHLPHALPPYILLGRTLGISEDELRKAWAEERREEIIKRAAASGKQ